MFDYLEFRVGLFAYVSNSTLTETTEGGYYSFLLKLPISYRS